LIKQFFMLINLSNHPSSGWSVEQTNKAKELYGNLVDVPFPEVDPVGNEQYIHELTDEYLSRIISIQSNSPKVVHVMGELTFCYALIKKLKMQGIKCIASTTVRDVVVGADGKITKAFKFVQFREYL